MSLGLRSIDSIHSIHLRFRRSATSVLTLGNDLTHTRTSLSSVSNETCYGLGSDLGTFLYWFGERLIDTWVDVLIRIRLRAIRRAFDRRGNAPTVDIIKARYIRHACEDLLELCSGYYSLRTRRKAMRLLLVLLRPLDAWSLILLSSNFVEVLSAYKPETSNDPVMAKCFGEIVQIDSLVSTAACCCETCLVGLRQETPHVRYCLTPRDQIFSEDSQTRILHALPKILCRKIRNMVHPTQHST